MLTQLGAGFGMVTSALLILFGIYTTAKTRGGALRKFPKMFRLLRKPPPSTGDISPLRAFATSLSGTIGVGNMTGVALAIAKGGAGAVFWMWISALLCMTIKQFEIFLALRNQPKEEHHYGFGPMIYIKKATESRGFPLLFSLLGLFSALTMGSIIQTKAAADAATYAFSCPKQITVLLFILGIACFLSGGISRIMGRLEKALPLAGGAFLLVGLTVLALRAGRILPCIKEIFSDAFSFSSLSGGFLGTGIALSFRYGVGNGLFSHEAGLGSAGLVHGACGANAQQQSLWGAFEVFLDTMVISTLSALMILTTGQVGTEGHVLAAAEAVAGKIGGGIMALCIILFAFLSVSSWCCCGETCYCWITEKKTPFLYRILFLLSPAVALLAQESVLWNWAEIVNGGMMILNLTALIGHRKELRRLYPKLKKNEDSPDS